MELNTAGSNTYAAMPLPGSQLYKNAVDNKIKLPENYEGYSFHSYYTQPLPTEYLTPEEVLEYRDECYTKYHTYLPFLEKINPAKYHSKAAHKTSLQSVETDDVAIVIFYHASPGWIWRLYSYS